MSEEEENTVPIEEAIESMKETQESKEESQSEVEGEPKKKKAPLYKRMRQLTTNQRENRATIERLENELKESNKANLIEKPNKDNFNDVDAYVEQNDKYTNQQRGVQDAQAVDNYKANQRHQEDAQDVDRAAYKYDREDRVKAVKEYKNYGESEGLVNQAIQDYKIQDFQNDILGSKVNTALVDFLGQNPIELEEIAYQYATEPRKAARLMGRLEAKLSKAPIIKGGAPDPLPKTGTAGGVSVKSGTEETQAEYNIRKMKERG